MLGVGVGKYQIKSLAIIVACLLTGQMAYAEDDSVKKKDEKIDEKAIIDLSKVVVAANVTNIMGIEPGVSKGEVGKGSINQTQMDIIQANNMASALDKVPGVTMSGSHRPGGQTINIWGMGSSKDVPITLDGALKTFDKYQQGTLYVDPDIVKQVSVNKGDFDPASMNGAFGGSIQMKTKDATDFLKDNQNLGAYIKYGHHGNNDQNNYSAAIYGQTKNQVLDGLIYVTKTDANNYELGNGDVYKDTSYKQKSLLLKGNIHFSAESKLTLSYSDTRYKGWMPPAAKSGNTQNYDPNDDYARKRRLVYRDQKDQTYSANFEYLPVDNPYINFKADIAYSKTSQYDQKVKPGAGQKAPISILGMFGRESWIDYKNTTVHLSNKSVLKSSWIEHHITVGAQYVRKEQNSLMFHDGSKKYLSEEFNYGYFTVPYLPAGRQTVTSAYVNDDIKIGYLTISPSLRYDYVRNQSFGNVAGYSSTNPVDGHDYRSVSYDGLTSKIGLYWQQSDAWALFADYSHSWRAPNIDEQYTVQGKGVRGPNGTSRYLGKEKLNAFRIGGLVSLQNVMSEGDLLSVKVTAFQNKVKNEVIRKIGAKYCESHYVTGSYSGCGKPMGAFHNGPGYTIKGIELEAKYDSEYIFGGLAATTMKGRRIGSEVNNWAEGKSWIRDIPPRELTATLGFNVPKYNLSLGWEGQFVRKQTRTAAKLKYPLTPGYSVHNLFMVYQPFGEKDLKVNLTINNLFNKNYTPYLSEGIPSPGRDIRLSVSYQF